MAAPVIQTPPAPGVARADPDHKVNILLVDDREDNLFSIETILENENYIIVKAHSGKAALKILLTQHDFTLILMDVQMPEMDGLEATRRIRKELLKQPVIVALTANAMQGDREECLQAGMDDYISKPVRLDELMRLLEKWAVQRA